MTRTQVREHAKQLVLTHGPSDVFEFGTELLSVDGYEATDAAVIVAEARVQAERVYSFLGYASPWASSSR